MSDFASGDGDKSKVSHFASTQPVDLALTADQYLIIQHFLPKRYALVEQQRAQKRSLTSMQKLGLEDIVMISAENPNISKLSGNISNTDDHEGRLKRARIKKMNRYLEEDAPRNPRKAFSEKFEESIADCGVILAHLKKHKSSYPFMNPVDPKLDNAEDYFDIIKEPMDFSTIERKLKSGSYLTPSEFHGDVCRIWENSYLYNDKLSPVHKLTVEIEKYYRSLLNKNPTIKKPKKEKLEDKKTERMELLGEPIEIEPLDIAQEPLANQSEMMSH